MLSSAHRLALLAALALASAAPQAAQTSNSAANASPVALPGHKAAWAVPENDRGLLPATLALNHLTILLKRTPAQQKAFEEFLRAQQDTASPSYHRWLTPTELGEKFGVDSRRIAAVTHWLASQGLHVDGISNSRTFVVFSGTAAAVGAAFGSTIHYYDVNGDQRISIADDPVIPAALADSIQSIAGLYTIRNRPYGHGGRGMLAAPGSGPQPAGSFCGGGSCSYYVFPADFATIYDINSLYSSSITGSGQNIAIIGRSRVDSNDIDQFESFTGLASKLPTVIVPPSGVDPGPAQTTCCNPSEDQLEATLDVTRSTSVAPGATIDLVVSLSTGSLDGIAIAAEYVVDTNPVPAHIMNISFGACEADAGQSGVNFWNTIFSQAAGEGISVFVASGDAGAAGCDAYNSTPPATQTRSPNYICSSSYATCTGGTEFAEGSDPSKYWSSTNSSVWGSALSYIPEGGWNEPTYVSGGATLYQASGSGGGVSSYIATPSWQTGTGVPGTVGRYTPDISFSSSAHDGYFACLESAGNPCQMSGGGFYFEYFYGTSAAGPDMSGITALLNQKTGSAQGNLNPRLYELAAAPGNAVFHDVTATTSGVTGCAVTTPSMCNNSTPTSSSLTGGLAGYLVTDGYDEVTGLGSIDVANLLSQFGPEATTTTVTGSATIYSGASLTLTATITTKGLSTPTGTVTFYNGTTSLGSSPVNSSAVATLTTTSLVTVGGDSITASYGGDANNLASTSTILAVTVNPASFNMTASPSTTTVTASQTASYTVTVTPLGSYGSTVSFSATMTPAPVGSPTLTFSPSTLTPGSSTSTTTLTIQGASNAVPAHGMIAVFGLWIPLGFTALLLAGGRRRSLRRVLPQIALALALALSFGASFACSPTHTTTQQSQTYQVQITATAPAGATSQAVTTSTTVTLIVQ